MTCPFSKLGLSGVLWSAHFNSLLLLHLVLSLLLFRSKSAVRLFWHRPQLAYVDSSLQWPSSELLSCWYYRGSRWCSWALVLNCIRGFLELNNDLRNTVKREKDRSPFIGLAGWYRRTGKINLTFLSISVNWGDEGENDTSSLDQVFCSWFFCLLCSDSLWVQSKALWSQYKDCFVFNRLWIKAHMTWGKLLQIKCYEVLWNLQAYMSKGLIFAVFFL